MSCTELITTRLLLENKGCTQYDCSPFIKKQGVLSNECSTSDKSVAKSRYRSRAKRNALRSAVTRSPSPPADADLAERIKFGVATGRWMRDHAENTVKLDLRDAQFSTLSVEILRFSNLTELNLSHNNFHQVPAVLASMDHLKIVWLHDNPLDKNAFEHVAHSQITFMLDKVQHTTTDKYGTSRWLVLAKK